MNAGGFCLARPQLLSPLGSTPHSLGLAQAARPWAEHHAPRAPVLLPYGPVLRLTAHTPRVQAVVFVPRPMDENELYISFVDCANTVVFLPLALRQGTHRNAIRLSRYDSCILA